MWWGESRCLWTDSFVDKAKDLTAASCFLYTFTAGKLFAHFYPQIPIQSTSIINEGVGGRAGC